MEELQYFFSYPVLDPETNKFSTCPDEIFSEWKIRSLLISNNVRIRFIFEIK